MSGEPLFLGIDVGTGSARAGVFNGTGQMLASAVHPIITWRDGEKTVEQSTENIWQAVCAAVRSALASANIDARQIAAIGFAATCSLAVIGRDGEPISISLTGDPARNVIVWMDHRAEEQANRINVIGGAPLAFVGGAISPEMQLPKVLWLKENLPRTFINASAFMDLTDYLTWRATGSLERSSCTMTCKWSYLAHESRWDLDFLENIGLGDLAHDGCSRIGTDIVAPGAALQNGLLPQAALELGLQAGIPVAAGLIDAHAGGLGSLPFDDEAGDKSNTRVAYVFGTSACLMATSSAQVHVSGVWGPYWSAMLPDCWLLEGGQTAAGAAIDFILQSHPAFATANLAAQSAGISIVQWLELRITARFPVISLAALETSRLHFVPDFAGNRTPLADPNVRGIMSGLSLSNDLISLENTYIAAVLGVAYGASHILSVMEACGVKASQIVISGGAAKSTLVRQLLADATGVPVFRPASSEPVLLGAAMLAAVASGRMLSVNDVRSRMVKLNDGLLPAHQMASFHAWKFKTYRMLQNAERELWAEYQNMKAAN